MGRFVTVAVVRSQPPAVFVAEDIDTMHWVLATSVVARTLPTEVPPEAQARLRRGLLEERWAETVAQWMKSTGVEVDIFPSEDVISATDVAMAASEVQFGPLFASSEGPTG